MVRIYLDGKGHTRLSFFDNMLSQIARHSSFNLLVHVDSDLHVDEDYTINDTALALGAALLEAVGDKRGIKR